MKVFAMRGFAVAALGLSALGLSTGAQAAATVCTTDQLANAASAIACTFVSKNANSNSVESRTDQQAAIGALGASSFTYDFGNQADNSFKDGIAATSLGTSISFGTDLFGETIVAMHFGGGKNSPFGKGSGGFTAFYLFDFGVPTSSITLTNVNSLSNAHLYVTGQGIVPEPQTWALLVLGFGALGGAMRRSRTASAAARSAIAV